MVRQLSSILPTPLTYPSSHTNTSNWTLVSSPSLSLRPCFLMPIATTWLATSAAEQKSVTNQGCCLSADLLSLPTHLLSSSTTVSAHLLSNLISLHFFIINIMFMKLIRFNKLILNINVFSILWEMSFNNLLISPLHMTLGWTF
jgi:hypothetical protein